MGNIKKTMVDNDWVTKINQSSSTDELINVLIDLLGNLFKSSYADLYLEEDKIGSAADYKNISVKSLQTDNHDQDLFFVDHGAIDPILKSGNKTIAVVYFFGSDEFQKYSFNYFFSLFSKRAEELNHTKLNVLPERRLEEFMQESKDIIYFCNHQGNFTYINPIATKLSGFSLEEILGKSFLSFIREDYKIRASEFYKNQFKNLEENSYFEYPILSKDGCTIWLGQNVQLHFANGRISGFQAIARDISRLKEAEIQKEKYQRSLHDSEEKFKLLST